MYCSVDDTPSGGSHLQRPSAALTHRLSTPWGTHPSCGKWLILDDGNSPSRLQPLLPAPDWVDSTELYEAVSFPKIKGRFSIRSWPCCCRCCCIPLPQLSDPMSPSQYSRTQLLSRPRQVQTGPSRCTGDLIIPLPWPSSHDHGARPSHRYKNVSQANEQHNIVPSISRAPWSKIIMLGYLNFPHICRTDST